MIYKDRERRIWLTVKLVMDALIALVSFTYAYAARFDTARFAHPFDVAASEAFRPYLFILLLAPVIRITCSFMAGLYQPKRGLTKVDALFIAFKAVALGSLVMVVLIFSYRGIYAYREFSYSRLVVLLDFAFNLPLVVLSRVAIGYADGWLRKRGVGLKKAVFAGYNSEADKIVRDMQGDVAIGYRVMGYVGQPFEGAAAPRLGGLDEVVGVLRQSGADELYVLDSAFSQEGLMEISSWCEKLEVDLKIIPSLYMIMTAGTKLEEVASIPVISMKKGGITGWDRVLKDMEDYVLSFAGLLLLSPLLLIVALLIKLDSAGQVFFKQERVGKNGKRFTVYKFRSMSADAEGKRDQLLAINEADGPIFKVKKDPRITRVGRFIRKTSIDELPQLINVVRGEMSLVGPRPLPTKEVDLSIRGHLDRLAVLPGITGLWQVSGRSDLTFDEMVKLDVYYIRNWSLWLDLKIILRTIPAVLFSKGAY